MAEGGREAHGQNDKQKTMWFSRLAKQVECGFGVQVTVNMALFHLAQEKNSKTACPMSKYRVLLIKI